MYLQVSGGKTNLMMMVMTATAMKKKLISRVLHIPIARTYTASPYHVLSHSTRYAFGRAPFPNADLEYLRRLTC